METVPPILAPSERELPNADVVGAELLPPVLLGDSSASTGAWGAWATLGLGLANMVAMVVGQSVGVVLFLGVMAVRGRSVQSADELSSNGLMLSLATLAELPVTVGVSWLFAFLKAGRRAAFDYLALKRTGVRPYIWGTLGLGGVVLLWMGVAKVFHLPEVPPFVEEAYRTAELYPLLWLAIIGAAPIMEEILFRGFFYEGLSRSRVGVAGAILIPSVLWAALHVQYGIHEILLIFVGGILLGLLRRSSGSVVPCIVIHAVSNLLSMIEVALLVGRNSP